MNKLQNNFFLTRLLIKQQTHCKVQLNLSMLSGQRIWQTFKSHWLEDEYGVFFGVITITTLVLVIFLSLPMMLCG